MEIKKYCLGTSGTLMRVTFIILFFTFFLFSSKTYILGIMFGVGYIINFMCIIELERQAMESRGELK